MKENGLRVYSAPAEEIPSDDFELSLNGRPVFVHAARVSAYPVNAFCPGFQRPLAHTEMASFASWEQDGPVEVTAVSQRTVDSVRIRPTERGIEPTVSGNTISFIIREPGQYTVEVNGTHHTLHLFSDPPEKDVPVSDDTDMLIFGPGVHCAGLIRMKSGQTVYIAAGAVVYGAILAEKVSDIAILGRGILDGSRFSREHLTGLICLYECDNVRMEGITLRDSSGFNVIPMACRGLHIRNIKLIGNWRYNSDGVDFMNCRDCSLEESFLRTFDDSVCVKGYRSFGPFIYRLHLAGQSHMDRRFSVDGAEGTFAELQNHHGIYPCPQDACDNIQVRKCVIWCDWGRPLEVGAETQADEIHHISFVDCDLIHNICGCIMSVQNSDRALCRDIVYRDIRVELDDEPRRSVIIQDRCDSYEKPYDGFLPTLFKLANAVGYVSADEERGCIEDVRFEDIAVTAPQMPKSRLDGFDTEHQVQRVHIRNLTLNGQPVTDLKSAGVQMNEFTNDITIKGRL